MWTKKKKIYYLLYSLLGKWLPESRHLHLAKHIRNFFGKRIIKNAGININIEHGSCFTPELSLGDYSGIGVHCELYGEITIGKKVMMGPEVVFYTQNHKHDLNVPFMEQGYEKMPISIGDNVWIGRRVMFMPGSSLGNNVVVAAGSVVTKQFPDNVLVAGIPAKVIRELL